MITRCITLRDAGSLADRFRARARSLTTWPRSGGIYHQCMKELQKPHPDYAIVQALATPNLVEMLQELAGQVAELSAR